MSKQIGGKGTVGGKVGGKGQLQLDSFVDFELPATSPDPKVLVSQETPSEVQEVQIPPDPEPGETSENGKPVRFGIVPKKQLPLPTKEDCIKLNSLENLFKTMHRMIASLSDLDAEFQLKLPDGTLFWLVPSYTAERERRNEISFNDAATVTVICSAYGGTVVQFKFLGGVPSEV